MRLKIDHNRSHRKWIRRLRNPKFIGWISIIAIWLVLPLAVLYAILHLYYWLDSAAHPPFARFIFIFTNLLFGLASVISVILAVWILGNINPERFTTAQELLRHCIDLFDDANKNNCNVKLLILFPNPGQFDEVYYLPREYHFSDLKKKFKHCLSNQNVNIEIVCLRGDTINENSTLRKFLKMFYESESEHVNNPQELENRGNLEGYCAPVKNFIEAYLTDKPRLKLEYIDNEWLDKMAEGEPMIVIGYAKREAFLGAITFRGPKFNFEGFDFEGNIATIEPLYNAMKKRYIETP